MTTSAERLTFGIVGVGPVGGTLAAALSRAGHRVIVSDVDAGHLDAIRRNGLEVVGVREIHGRPERCHTSVREMNHTDYDYFIVSTKAAVFDQLSPHLASIAGPRAFVVSAQNGLDTEKAIANVVGADRTLRIVINYAGGRAGDGRLNLIFYTGHNQVGASSLAGEAAAKRLAGILADAGLETDHTPEVRRFEWEKTILNAALSPLCGLTGLTMKECTEWPAMAAIIETLIDEGIAVAKADGFTWDSGFRDHCIDYLRKGGYHRPSLWVDLDQRRKTEIGVLSGRIADIADARGVAAPTHRLITTLVEGVERSFASTHGK